MFTLPHWLSPGDDRPTAEIDDEIEEELRLHLDLLALERVGEGLSEREAQEQAAGRFGDLDSIKRRCRVEKQGDVPMLKRVQTVLTLLLLVAVGWLGVREYVSANATTQYMNQTTDFLRTIRGDLADLREDMASVAMAPLPSPQPSPAYYAPPAVSSTSPAGPHVVLGPNGERIVLGKPIGTLSDSENYTLVKKRNVRANLSGVATDTKGNPLADADVLLIVKTWPNNRFRQDDYAIKTDDAGEFVLKGRIPLDGQYGVNAVVVADGHAIASRYVLVEDPSGQPPEKLGFKLPESTETRIVVTDAAGKPLAKALVGPSERIDAEDEEHLVYHQGSNPVWKKTDDEGAVTIDWFAPGDLGKVNIRPRGGEWQEKKIEVTEGKRVTLKVED
ncbi:hypothetical protein MalM25_11960 [Planctomycetes bacterium MalM25]|nr:hypothetical protein MalM25_11960 [Planctomycetes bacterium MalM25]